jgi:hypothetical protein
MKVGVWCAVSARRILVPVFFNGTINCKKYQSVERAAFQTTSFRTLSAIRRADSSTKFICTSQQAGHWWL